MWIHNARDLRPGRKLENIGCSDRSPVSQASSQSLSRYSRATAQRLGDIKASGYGDVGSLARQRVREGQGLIFFDFKRGVGLDLDPVDSRVEIGAGDC